MCLQPHDIRHARCASAHTTSVAGLVYGLIPRHRSHRRRVQQLPLPPQLPPLLSTLQPLQRPLLPLPLPPLSRPYPPGPPALPSPPRPPCHTLHGAMLLHSSSPCAHDATLSGVTCCHCFPAVLSWRIYVTHPVAASAVKAAARDTGATAEEKDSLERDKYSRTGAGACRFVPLSYETFGRAGPAEFPLLNAIAEFGARSGVVSKRFFFGERHA